MVAIVSTFQNGFNPRPREGGDNTTAAHLHGHVWFQSTPPRRRRLGPQTMEPSSMQFQSTPPRRRRRRKAGYLRLTLPVSIHAPAKEATYVTLIPKMLQWFQSTPPRRRRHEIMPGSINRALFQSTPPRRRRHCHWLRPFVLSMFQSTPPRRRRLSHRRRLHGPAWFQSTPPRRRRLATLSGVYWVMVGFQSTPPRRRRPKKKE